jgi:hypothetical protein
MWLQKGFQGNRSFVARSVRRVSGCESDHRLRVKGTTNSHRMPRPCRSVLNGNSNHREHYVARSLRYDLIAASRLLYSNNPSTRLIIYSKCRDLQGIETEHRPEKIARSIAAELLSIVLASPAYRPGRWSWQAIISRGTVLALSHQLLRDLSSPWFMVVEKGDDGCCQASCGRKKCY